MFFMKDFFIKYKKIIIPVIIIFILFILNQIIGNSNKNYNYNVQMENSYTQNNSDVEESSDIVDKDDSEPIDLSQMSRRCTN